ncbi:MAG: Phage protein Gp37/Gp68 [bacterium ADurb.Bin429]|nr:MAG: Phage protein Gp37/Gp68 [bacterium ADurb.Bin429]
MSRHTHYAPVIHGQPPKVIYEEPEIVRRWHPPGEETMPESEQTEVTTRAPTDLRPHPMNARLYGSGYDETLRVSIEEEGIITPLVITRDNVIISGHRRLAVALALDLETVPVTIIDETDQLEVTRKLILANTQRERTNEMKAREYRTLKHIETERARRRQQQSAYTTNIRLGRGNGTETVGESRPESSGTAGRARDLAATVIGWSGKSADKAVAVLEAIETLDITGQEADASRLRQRFQRSIAGAHRTAQQAGLLPAAKGTDATFNITNTSVDWAHWTWNPITGCQHGCDYCYARDMATRFPAIYRTGTLLDGCDDTPFAPRFHPQRLTAPANTKVPRAESVWTRTVFVGSMADLFGAWVPQEWIDQVMDAVRAAPQWTFIFLTKNPRRLIDVDWPTNAWVGATVDTQARVAPTEAAFAEVTASVKFVSCEPLLAPVQFSHLDRFNWLIIGGRSLTTSGPECQPEWTWVQSLLAQARAAGCAVYCKPNLRPQFPRDLPTGVEQESQIPCPPPG